MSKSTKKKAAKKPSSNAKKPRSLLADPVRLQLDGDTARRSEAFRIRYGRKAKLVALWVGDNASSAIYIKRKSERAVELGMIGETRSFDKNAQPSEVRDAISRLNQDPTVDGILLQRPLPPQFNERELITWIEPSKDVDCFHPENVGLLFLGQPRFAPCTPAGVMAMLAHYKIAVAGKRACVIGRSTIVGKPMAQLLLQADATVTIAHSRTRDLASVTREADIVVVAAGKPALIGRKHIKKGAVVIDVGIHRDKKNRICGDVRASELNGIAKALSPVPGGVGPLTISLLFQNTIAAAEQSEQRIKR